MRFLVFADFHYKKGMYASTLEQLHSILRRAHNEGAEFVIHLGDFSNDYAGSSEVVGAYLNNAYGLPVFGIYGNHELETVGNSMATVTSLLCNREVCFAGGDAGYWHYDIGGYRLIGLDTNYSYNAQYGTWQHNLAASWGAPNGNLYSDSLSPRQLAWLEWLLTDACSKGLKALVFSHAALSGEWESSPDAAAVREIFGRYPGTVVMSLNGHLHTDHFCVKDGVAYFDVNSVLNGYWEPTDSHHYSDAHTFVREVFDGGGNATAVEEVPLNTLSQSKNTWFFDEPLSAMVEISGNRINIAGSSTDWKYGIAPATKSDSIKAGIADRHVIIE